MKAIDGKKMYLTGALLILLGVAKFFWPDILVGVIDIGPGELVLSGLGMVGLKGALKKAGTGA